MAVMASNQSTDKARTTIRSTARKSVRGLHNTGPQETKEMKGKKHTYHHKITKLIESITGQDPALAIPGFPLGDTTTDSCLQENLNAHLESLCRVWSVYDNVVRFNRVGADKSTWMEGCDELEPMQDVLCPSEPVVDTFCAGPLKSDLNPVVRQNYCQPLFAGMFNSTQAETCVDHCVNYVSQDRGSCCGWQCPESLAPSGSPTVAGSSQ